MFFPLQSTMLSSFDKFFFHKHPQYRFNSIAPSYITGPPSPHPQTSGPQMMLLTLVLSRIQVIKCSEAIWKCDQIRDADQVFDKMHKGDYFVMPSLSLRFLSYEHLEESVGRLSKETEKYRSAHENMKNKLNEEYEEQAELKRKFHQGVDMLDQLNSKIERYERENIFEKLKELEEKRSAEKSKLQYYKSKNPELPAEVEKASELVRGQDALKRNIEDNLRYREVKEKVEWCILELESLDEKNTCHE